jgi:hypothetical protein
LGCVQKPSVIISGKLVSVIGQRDDFPYVNKLAF